MYEIEFYELHNNLISRHIVFVKGPNCIKSYIDKLQREFTNVSFCIIYRGTGPCKMYTFSTVMYG